MSPGSDRIARILKLWFDFCFYAGLLGVVALLFWLLVSPFQMLGRGVKGETAIPVSIGSGSLIPVLQLEASSDSRVMNPRLVKGRGELRFETTDWWLQFIPNTGFVLLAAAGLYIISLVRKILASVLNDQPFEHENARHFQMIGAVTILAGLLVPFFEYLTASWILSSARWTGLQLAPTFRPDIDYIVGGFLLIVLSRAFSRGSRIEEEQSLTI